MSTLLRFFTLLTIAAAGFALPMTCAQSTGAAEPVAIELPAQHRVDVSLAMTDDPSAALPGATLVQHLFDTLPLDCGESATPRASEQPATFDTQPFVPGYLVSTIQIEDQQPGASAPPPPLIPIDSRAGPPDAPPPKSIA